MRSLLTLFLLLVASVALATPDRAAVVKILVVDEQGDQNWLSGAIVQHCGRYAVLTNSHGFRDGCRELHVYSGDFELPATVIYQGDPDAGNDIAVIRVTDWQGPAMRMAAAEPQIGQALSHGGFPRGAAYQLNHGRVIGRHHHGWYITGQSIGGQSGSAVVDSQGYVVGLLFGSVDGQTYLHGLQEVDRALREAWPKMVSMPTETQYCPPGVDCDQGGYVVQQSRPLPYRGTVAQPVIQAPQQTATTSDLINRLAQDPRFRGQPGERGPPGDRGPQGLTGERGPMPGPDVVREALTPALDQLRGEFLASLPVDNQPEIGIDPEPATDWLGKLLQVASALGLEIAIPGGTLGVVGVWMLRTWLGYRRLKSPELQTEIRERAKRLEDMFQPAPKAEQQVDAGRSSPPVDRPQ